MSRWFNTAGPCKADIHYMLSLSGVMLLSVLLLSHLLRIHHQKHKLVSHRKSEEVPNMG